MKLLHLDSSILAENSASRELSAAIVARWQREVPGIEVLHRDLAGSHALPHLDGASLAKADAVQAARAQRALDEFLAADVVVIGVPMYNFGIDDISFITAEGLAISPAMRSEAMDAAHARIDEALPLAA